MYTSLFSMKFLNKLADADVLADGCNLLKDRWLWCFVLDPFPANSHEKIGESARCRCCNTLLINHFRNIGPANLFEQQSRNQPGGHNHRPPQLVGAQEQTPQKRIYPDSL